MTHAYDKIYLDDAMDALGGAVEYATILNNMDGQEFFDLFIASGIAEQFERGNVKYISGMSGMELAMTVLNRCGKNSTRNTYLSYIDYPPEYWTGWILAYYQWESGKPFKEILKKIPFETIFRLYYPLHEVDPRKARDVFDKMMVSTGETNLAKLRKLRELSQSQLAKESGVSIRSIQLYEQRQTNINNAQHNHLKSLANVLCCKIEDILE